VNIQAASLDQSTATNGHQLLEVELGDLKSLSHDEVTVKQMKTQGLKSGQNVIDDEQSSEYKLVMVGRKVSQDEYEQNQLLADLDAQHMLSSDIYHESNEQFS